MAIRGWTESSFELYVTHAKTEVFSRTIIFGDVLRGVSFDDAKSESFIKYALTRMFSENATNACASVPADMPLSARVAAVAARVDSMCAQEISTDLNSGLDPVTICLRAIITTSLKSDKVAGGETLKTQAAAKLAQTPRLAARAFLGNGATEPQIAAQLAKWTAKAELMAEVD